MGLQISLEEVKSFIVRYNGMSKGVFKWRQASVVEARAQKRIRTKIGRHIRIPDDASNRYLFNLPVQATDADGFKLALFNVSEKLDGLDALIVHTQHDEIIVEAKEDIANQVQTIVEESMEEPLERIIPEVPFVAEIRMVEAWG